MIVYAPKTHNIKVVSGIGVAFEYESVDESGDPVNFPSNTGCCARGRGAVSRC